MSMTTQEFIQKYRNDDVRKLAFMHDKYADVDMPFALEQIKGWQTACHKLPSWAATEGMIYPPQLSMEQCSSEQTALLKADIVRNSCPRRRLMIDLTGGFGVDFSFMARHFEQAVYVERQEGLCAIARHNFQTMGLEQATVEHADSEEYLRRAPKADLIFMDPARRDSKGGRTFAIADCTPDVTALLPLLLMKADRLLVKLSPMLDWHKAVKDMGQVSDVYVVAVGGECKELLLQVVPGWAESPRIHCIEDGMEWAVEPPQAMKALPVVEPLVGHYLYVPGAAAMKVGCFDAMEQTFGMRQLAPNSHLFLSSELIEGFPGRRFRLTAVSSFNKKELRERLSGLAKANVAVRNFPMTAEALRQKLKLKDGGESYLFGTTDDRGAHLLLIGEKL